MCNKKSSTLAAYWANSIRRHENELYTGRATLLATPAGVKSLCNLSSAVAASVAKATTVRRSDGRTEVTIPIESIEHAAWQLMGLSPQIEVLRPPALGRAMVERLKKIGELYGIHVEADSGSAATR